MSGMFRPEPDDEIARRRFTRRALLLGVGQAAAFGVISAKLFRTQVIEGVRYAPLAEENRISVEMLAPQRGRILDRYGEVLAANIEGYRAVLLPSLAGDVERAVATFSRVVPLGAEQQARIVARAKRQPLNVPVILAGELTFEQIAEINLFAPNLPGVRTEVDSRRRYYHSRETGHVVGYVGAVERHALDDDPVLRLPGMRTGRSGIELGMEETLRGEGGHVRHEVDARGRVVRDLDEVLPQAGADVVLTLDTQLQASIAARLERERSGALVAMDVASGEVVAMVSVPAFDNAEFATPGAGRTLRRLETVQHNPMINRAIRGAYPPGSTFKMITALAAIESGVVALREKIRCDGRYEFGGQVFRCWKRRGHGDCDLHRALKESCDCYFYELARRAGIDAIAQTARRFGLGQAYDCGIAHQKRGVVPDPDWKRARFGKPWFGGETILAAIGQGFVQATPLQLAVMTARLASGRAVQPTLVKRADPSAPPDLPVNRDWLEAVRRAMTAVVNEEGGTGAAARLDDPAQRVAGKTGTAQVSRASSEKPQAELKWEERDHALFVAYAPAAAPRYAVAAVVEHAGSGGAVVGPIVREVMAELLARDPSGRAGLSAREPGRRQPPPGKA